MKIASRIPLATIALCILSLTQTLLAEETFKWTTEEGWGGERIKLPAGFAEDMQVKGIEEIRFAPGWRKPDSPNFFSYVFVFAVEGKDTFSDKVIERELMTYYKGLCKAVIRNPDLDVSGFKIDMTKDKTAGKGPANATNIVQYSAKLDWIEPFATKKSQQLNFEIQSYSIPGSESTFLFVAASPSKTDSDIWTKMRAVRATLEHNPK
ncbi:MAG: hypothetical protein ACI9G1_005687 [Pirellulaceae bacterium]|jgi:hypothetical protein